MLYMLLCNFEKVQTDKMSRREVTTMKLSEINIREGNLKLVFHEPNTHTLERACIVDIDEKRIAEMIRLG